MNIGCITLVPYKGKMIGIECKKGRGSILPGGKWEHGETFVEAAKREFEEETGMKIGNLHYVFGGPDGSGYYCYCFSGVLLSEFKENVTPEGNVKLVTWEDLGESTFRAYYELLRMHWID